MKLTNKEAIEKYLIDFDNLYQTGWFNNPNSDITDYTFHHKNVKDLKHFLFIGREIIRQSLMDEKLNPKEK